LVMVALGSAMIILFPLSFPFLGMIVWPDTHLCCEWSSYGIHGTFPCPSSDSWCCYFLMDLSGCLETSYLGFVLFSMVWGHLSLSFDS
jgi:hypothetical protein